MSKSKRQKDAEDFFATKPEQPRCCVCSARANFAFNDPEKGRDWFCRNHLPEHFNFPKTFVQLLEETFLGAKKEAAESAGDASAVYQSKPYSPKYPVA